MSASALSVLSSKFGKFFTALGKTGKKNRCLLFGKLGEDVYFTISGIHDHFKEAIPGYEEAREDIEGLLQGPEMKGFLLDGSPNLIYAPACKEILLYDKADFWEKNPKGGKTLEWARQNKLAIEDSFSCCERKLDAFLNHSGLGFPKLKDFEFLLCRYLPCFRCYPAVKGLTNFYVYGEKDCYHYLFSDVKASVGQDADGSKVFKLEIKQVDGYEIEFEGHYFCLRKPI